MAALPEVPRRFVTTEAPTSTVSGDTVAAPYAMLGKALDRAGEGLESASVVVAERAAQRAAVTVDANGNPTVETMPDFTGRAGIAYNRIAKHRMLAEAAPKIDAITLQKRAEFQGRPQDFQEWAGGYVDNLTGNQDDPAIAGALREMALQKTGAVYHGMALERQHLDLVRGNHAMDAQLKTLADDMEVIARQGGAGTDGFKSRMRDFDALLGEKVRNPAIAYPKEQADNFRDEVLTRAYGGAVLDRVEDVYRQHGFDAAREHLREAVKNLGGNVRQGDKIERQGMAWLRSEEAGLRGERDAISREWAAAKGQASTLPVETLIDIEQRATAIGANRVANDAAVTRSALEINKQLRGLPKGELSGIAGSGIIPSALIERIVGVESGGDASAQSPTSSALGAAQFTRGTWRDMIGRYRPDLATGKTDDQVLDLRRDPALSREMAARYAEENATRLRDAGVPVNAGSIYAAHFLGPVDAVKLFKANPATPVQDILDPASIAANRSVMDRNPTAGQLVAWAGRKVGDGLDLTQSREGLVALGMLKKDLAKDLQKRIDDFASSDRKLQLPAVDEIASLGAEVHAIGTPEQKQRVNELAAQAEYGVAFAKLTPAKRAEALSAWGEKLKVGATKFERELSDKLAHADRQIGEAFKKDPYGAAYRYMEGVPALPALDMTRDDAPAVLKAKTEQQNRIRADQGVDAFSALRPSEAEGVATALTQGPTENVGRVLGTLRVLPNDIYDATIASEPIKTALDGMVRSYDPVRLNAAMSVLDQQWRSDPVGFRSMFGEDTLKRLQVWQTWKDTATPQAIAERFQRADDPATRGAREELGKKADDEIKAYKPEDIAYQLGTGWYGIGRLTGSTPAIPVDTAVYGFVDGVQAERLHWEFGKLYKDLRESGVDKDNAVKKAAERLKTEWAPSVVANGALMRHPPELRFPQVDGSYDWMKRQIDETVATVHGPALDESGMGVNWAVKALVADKQTDAEIASGRRPTYRVVVTDFRTGSGNDQLFADKDGRTRFTFDPASAISASEAQFGEQRARAQAFKRDVAAGILLNTVPAVP